MTAVPLTAVCVDYVPDCAGLEQRYELAGMDQPELLRAVEQVRRAAGLQPETAPHQQRIVGLALASCTPAGETEFAKLSGDEATMLATLEARAGGHRVVIADADAARVLRARALLLAVPLGRCLANVVELVDLLNCGSEPGMVEDLRLALRIRPGVATVLELALRQGVVAGQISEQCWRSAARSLVA